MGTAEITVEQLMGMAQRLKTQELAGLVSRLQAILKGSPDTEHAGTTAPRQSLYGALADLGPAPSAEEIDQARKELFSSFPIGSNGPSDKFTTIRVGEAVVLVPADLEFAAAVAPIEKAWQQSGMSIAELNKVLDDTRKDIVRREFGDLFEDES